MTNRRSFVATSVAALLALPLLASPAVAQDKVTLTIESWRNDDLRIWEDVILPAFEATLAMPQTLAGVRVEQMDDFGTRREPQALAAVEVSALANA